MHRPIRTLATAAIGIVFIAAGLSLWTAHHSTVYASVSRPAAHIRPPAKIPPASLPYFKHVFIIMLENHSYQDAFYEDDMPYLRHLAQTYGLPTQMYGITNPTVPNRVGIVSGRGRTIGDNVRPGQLTYPTIMDQLNRHHMTWAAYYQHSETSSNTHPIYNFQDKTFNLFKDIYDNPSEQAHLKTFPELETDLKTGQVPNFVWVGPNFITNSHGTGRPGPYQYTYQGAGPGGSSPNDTRLEGLANSFLARWVPRIMQSPAWRSGPSAIFITEDETSYDASMPQIGEWASNLGTAGSPVVAPGTILGGNSAFPFPGGVNGGGRIPAVVITNTARHVVSSMPFNQFSILKTLEEAWHFRELGQAANPAVQTMGIFFHGGTPPQGPRSTPWSTGPAPFSTRQDSWNTTPYVPALPAQEVASPDATILPTADPHLTLGADGQAVTPLELFVTDHPNAITHDLTVTLTGSPGVTFARRSSPVGSTHVGNAEENATQFGPSVVTPRSITWPIAHTGTVAEGLDITGLMLDVSSHASLGPIHAKVSSDGVNLATIVLGTVGRPAAMSVPNLMAPVIRAGTVQIRFIAPTTLPHNALYEIQIQGRNPTTAVGPDLGQYYIATARHDNLIISNGAAELTSLAGKPYWVRVRLVGGRRAQGPWSRPLPFTALPGPLPHGVS